MVLIAIMIRNFNCIRIIAFSEVSTYLIHCFTIILCTLRMLSVWSQEGLLRLNLYFFYCCTVPLITLKFLSQKNAPLYYTYKMLKFTVKISHDCSYMFRCTWTTIREPMPNLAKVTILWRIISKNTSLNVQQCW